MPYTPVVAATRLIRAEEKREGERARPLPVVQLSCASLLIPAQTCHLRLSPHSRQQPLSLSLPLLPVVYLNLASCVHKSDCGCAAPIGFHPVCVLPAGHMHRVPKKYDCLSLARSLAVPRTMLFRCRLSSRSSKLISSAELQPGWAE